MNDQEKIVTQTANEFKHISVLRDESIEGLNIRPDGIYVDGTMGGAGHTRQVLLRLSSQGRMIGIDQDQVAIDNAHRLFKEDNQESRITLVHDNFSHIEKILQELEIDKVDGFLLDLGVSSKQLDDGERGFSYQQDAPLDMRMDSRNALSAREVVNTYSHDELRRILTEYGEEKWSSRIADFIVKEREKQPIETTFDLVRVIKQAIPKGARQDGPHPAKRSFQAIRVEVNQELTILESTLEAMARHLNPGGRICVITFHSLEDRIIKQCFKKLENPCTCPPEFPVCVCGKKPLVKVITRKPILPSEEEIEANPRSRSAKLRIAEGV